MNTTWICRLTFILIVFATVALRAPAMVFTGNTEIGPNDTNYDGQDIVILDCTVSIDGPHTFSSLVLAANGVLTHSFSTNGDLYVPMEVTNTPIVLSGTTPIELAVSNTVSSLVVTDVTDTNGNAYVNGIDYLLPIINGNDEIERTTNSSIPDGGTVLVSYNYNGAVPVGLDLMVTGIVWVTSGCEINADGLGYGTGYGPGAGASSADMFFSGSGGGDGGSGGLSLSNALGGACYDSVYQPTLPGSGGGASYAGTGGNGGGLVRITAGGEVEIDGVVSANGYDATNSRSGGGSGGGIFISTPSLNGVGSFSANGGSGVPDGGGGGGGGHIAIVCGANNFTGTMTAYGGGGANYGGAGTIFTELMDLPGFLTLNNNGNPGANSTVTLPVLADVTVSNGAALAVSGSFSPQNVTIGTNCILTGEPYTPVQFSASNLTVNAGGAVALNGLGFLVGGTGLGGTYSTGGITYGGGGAHGGIGGAAAVTNATGGTTTYDTEWNAVYLGSSGGPNSGLGNFGGAGGGALNVNIAGTLVNNGLISANGSNGTGLASGFADGGGSGGSIMITANVVSGNGTMTANGGNGADSLGGGGGGGRIVINCNTNSFNGTLACYGGGGANYGGAGTIYLPVSGQEEIILDNGGNIGATTPIQPATFVNWVIQNGAWGVWPSGLGQPFTSLTIGSNSWLSITPGDSTISLLASGNVTIEAGGGITINSDGYPANTGDTGAARGTTVAPYPGGGGGNGGAGGAGETSAAAGGQAGYNSVTEPEYAGGGGGGFAPYAIGGNGGGALSLSVGGTLQVNGVITANGGNGSGAGGGGGAGGSLVLSAGTFVGSGSIAANGGNGVDSIGGGGGGGCIAITFNTNAFNGSLSALGGLGANDGGAGLIYSKTNSFGNGQLVLNNGGETGGPSIISSVPSGTDLTLSQDSILDYNTAAALTFGNLFISNASIVATNANLTINANNITLQNGGGIIANSGGYAANVGPGGGRPFSSFPFSGSGGGNAGCGGEAISNEVAGGAGGIEPFTEAIQPGSGGGGESPYSIGGSGGAVVQLNVSGTLTVNGTLSANGGNGGGLGGGGGAGGSLNLNVGSLTGSGVISANGGSGANNIGGGGGGGYITLGFNSSNVFTGIISAYGGGGATNGGAGTIFIKTNSTGFAALILDNGGTRGTNTPITTESTECAIVIRNGAVAAVQSASLEFSSLLIASNGWMVPLQTTPADPSEIFLTLNGSATIQAGGGIIADSYGYPQNTGAGHGSSYAASPWYPCSGAGHAGDGGFSLSNDVPGGATYDSFPEPELAGSGGGGYSSFSTGGAGGGFIELVAHEGLQVNGLISANGGNGSGLGGGGGSGGSIYLEGATTGTGSITANGGNGAGIIGGGGGGGSISFALGVPVIPLPPDTNFFHGTMSAYGGGGANYGGAGTIFVRTNESTTAQLILDNDNSFGTNTPISSGVAGSGLAEANLIVQNGAIGVMVELRPINVSILSNGVLTVVSGTQNSFSPENLTIAQGGALNLDGRGYGAQAGSGAGVLSGGIAGGGGHGGYGGGNGTGGAAYDSIQAPVNDGSGGANSSAKPGGAGGGALTLDVVDNLIVNGRLTANGSPGGLDAGGGAGGSIYLTGGNLSGNGVISANGGAGNGAGGGGAGGRIAVNNGNNNFTGQYSASGGGGAYPGGAGTIYSKVTGMPTLQVNNGGLAGANTPLSSAFSLPSTAFALDISGGASALQLTPLPLLSNLNVSAASTLTLPVAETNFLIGVLGNASIAGDLDVDYLGYPQASGPGAGNSQNNEGSGAGYGGAGGTSGNGASGGATYGSASAPINFGSGGGNGADTTAGGSAGGGALRLSVLGTLAVNGNISANGDSGLQDDSGGGSGGSVWISAGTLSGAGTISAYGGDGVLYGGGGGGGGRIAIYAPTNQFTGTTNVSGGLGIVSGKSGTVSLSSAPDSFQVASQSPSGFVSNTVSSVLLTFSDMINVSSFSPGDFTMYCPGTVVFPSVTVVSPFSVQLSFPAQNFNGFYTVQAQGAMTDMAGAPLQPYNGYFVIWLPTISGTVTDTNGAGVAGVTMQLSGGLTGGMTDTNGNYALDVPPGWTGTVTPSLGPDAFIPASLSYTNVTASITNQNYTELPTISPSLTSSMSAGNCCVNWTGISGVTYQVLCSTNLVTWQPLGTPITGTNGPMQFDLPTGSNAQEFFQIQAGD